MVRTVFGVVFAAIAGAAVGFTVSVVAALMAQLIVPLDSPPDYVLYGTPLGAVAGVATYLFRRRLAEDQSRGGGAPGTIRR